MDRFWLFFWCCCFGSFETAQKRFRRDHKLTKLTRHYCFFVITIVTIWWVYFGLQCEYGAMLYCCHCLLVCRQLYDLCSWQGAYGC
jgi:low temperature requirement protein LtrA